VSVVVCPWYLFPRVCYRLAWCAQRTTLDVMHGVSAVRSGGGRWVGRTGLHEDLHGAALRKPVRCPSSHDKRHDSLRPVLLSATQPSATSSYTSGTSHHTSVVCVPNQPQLNRLPSRARHVRCTSVSCRMSTHGAAAADAADASCFTSLTPKAFVLPSTPPLQQEPRTKRTAGEGTWQSRSPSPPCFTTSTMTRSTRPSCCSMCNRWSTPI
jgi:hypothetical protein